MKDNEELYFLFLRKKAGLTIEEENVLIADLLLNDPSARQLWDQINSDPYGVFENSDKEKAWEKLLPRVINRRKAKINYLKYAAAACLLVLAGTFLYLFTGNKTNRITDKTLLKGNYIVFSDSSYIDLSSYTKDSPPPLESLMAEGPGPASVVVRNISSAGFLLGDGSRLLLHPGATFTTTLPSGGGIRQGTITGEGFFEIAGNAKVPFILTVGKTTVKVLGTKFAVVNLGSISKVALASGAVLVTTPADSIVLKPGQQSTLNTNNHLDITAYTEVEMEAMENGFTYFHDQPLSDILTTIYLKYGITVKLDTYLPTGRHFSFPIHDRTEVEMALEAVIKTFGLEATLQVYQVKDTFHITTIGRK
ncbi:FecR family protein [Chitinophaga sp. YR573]|uniref:FecR family protein n=1 Tax=Chitinophaga sp. YR573 TaxID=1881040 RepID=UPI0008AE9BB5|nr:FecR family protein [Chitinophaga sp. YR573]SEW21180.1 FecR family protein [Chitinophaga sp. YR573]